MATSNHNPHHRAVLFQCVLEATSDLERNAARRAWSKAEEEQFRRAREYYEDLGRDIEARSGGRVAAHEATASFCKSFLEPDVEFYWLASCVLDAKDRVDLDPSEEARADYYDAIQELGRRGAEMDEAKEQLLLCLKASHDEPIRHHTAPRSIRTLT